MLLLSAGAGIVLTTIAGWYWQTSTTPVPPRLKSLTRDRAHPKNRRLPRRNKNLET